MANYFLQQQIEDMCVEAGFPRPSARIASAIAMAEAPAIGKPGYCDMDMVGDQALADEVFGYSLGAFQVRSLRSQKGTGQYRDELKLPNPTFNCRSARLIWSGQTFSAWSTYKSGAYRAYLQDLFPPPPGQYIVVSGDTLSAIGIKLKIPYLQLAQLNGLIPPYLLHIGQVLLLPYTTYKVQSGDTLSVIATLWGGGLTYIQLAAYNSISDPNALTVGQIIKIPRY
jgi:LysM repeat protein